MKGAQISLRAHFALIIVTLIISLAFPPMVSSALVKSSAMISSAGTVQYDRPPAINFADVPEDWRIGETWNAPTYLDYDVLHNGHPSIRMEKGDGTKSREILCADFTKSDWLIRIKPGDHVVFRVWMKTGPSSFGDTHLLSGIRLGVDFASSGSGYITGSASPDGQTWTKETGFPTNQYLNYVNWGHDWEQRTMDFIVQPQYQADGLFGTVPGALMGPPDIMTPWIQVWCGSCGNLDEGIAWFADAELYINP